MQGKRPQRIAAGGEQGLRARKLQRRVAVELDSQQRRKHRLMAARRQQFGLAAGIGLRPGDEEPHQTRLAMKSGPARVRKLFAGIGADAFGVLGGAGHLDVVPLAAVRR